MMTRVVSLTLAALVVAAGLVRAQSDGISVTPILAGGSVAAGFAAGPVVGPDVRTLVESGLVVTLTFVVDLKRPATGWIDRTVRSESVSASIKFDTLSGSYQVSRSQQGHVTFSDRTREFGEARDWATTFERIPLATDAALDPNDDYYIEVRASVSPRRTFSLWPSLWPFASADASVGRAAFTVIR